MVVAKTEQAIEIQVVSKESEDLVNRWLSFAGVATKSVVTYKGCLKQLFRYLSDNGIEKPARADLEAWRDSLIEGGKSASTVLLYLQAAKLFFRWLAAEGLYPNIADHLKARVKVDYTNFKKDALSTTQAKDLQRAVRGTNLIALRDRAIIALMLATGVRSIEVIRADYCDIRQLEGNYYLYLQGKGRYDKSECVLLPEKVYKYIQEYLKARSKTTGKKIGRNEALFVSCSRRNSGRRLTTCTIRRMIKANLRRIGLDTPTVSCHSLRHTCACTMFKSNESLANIQLVLRHKSLSTTMIYLNAINRLACRAEIAVAQVLII